MQFTPAGAVETGGDGARGPLDHGALDDAGLLAHQRHGAGGVLHAGLGCGIELAPGGALAVDELFPAQGGNPLRQALGGHALFLEIVELVVHALGAQPGAGLFHGVAIGYSVNYW